MPIVLADWSVDRATKNIRYVGQDHVRFGGTTPSYATTIEFHRWLQDLADDASYSSNDELDITDVTPSERATDNFITLINGYNIDATAAEHLYDGSIVQGGGTDIWDGIVNFGNSDVLIQLIQNGAVLADDWWNTTTGGLNADSAAGISHRFMLKTRTSGTDIDLRKILGTCRRLGKTYAEFSINGTSRGNNVLALADANDLNNTTVVGTISGWNEIDNVKTNSTTTVSGVNGTGQDILNVVSGAVFTAGEFIEIGNTLEQYQILSKATNALTLSRNLDTATAGGETVWKIGYGYQAIDVDGNGTPENYYSQWDKFTYTINQFYERMKWLVRDGSTTYLFGLPGELFRGITHQIALSGTNSGTFKANEHVTWSTGSGRMVAINNVTASSATKMWIQLLTGVVPSTQLITGAISGATATSSTITERPVAKPFIGQSTGSALIGAYGVGVEAADLASTDSLTDLLGNPVTPPNNVTFTVSGLVIGEDRILVGPESGGALNKAQFALQTSLTGVSTSVVITAAIPAGTAQTGQIRIERDDGLYSLHPFTSWTGSTFTITSHDFTANPATAGNDVFLAYIDKLATSTSEAFTAVYTGAARPLFIRVRDGGTVNGTPIKTFETTGSLGAASSSTTAIRTPDL